MLRINKKLIKMINRQLEMSVQPQWRSGSCIVTGSSNYNVFLAEANQEPMIVLRLEDSNYLIGFEVTRDADNGWTRCFTGTINGDTWTFVHDVSAFRHLANSTHGGQNTGQDITRIWGLIPKWDVISDNTEESSSLLMTDYIVSQGVEGNWTWRKWNSGVAECWGSFTIESATYAANNGYKQFNYTFPTNLFNAQPTVFAQGAIVGKGQSGVGFCTANNATTGQLYILNHDTSSATNTAWANIRVYGRWK